jgi:hypothetical protein
MASRSVLLPAIVAVGLVTYRGATNKSFVTNPVPYLPLPSTFVAVGLVFGALSLVPSEPLATLVGWGLDAAIFLNLWKPGATVTTPVLSPNTAPSPKGSTP